MTLPLGFRYSATFAGIRKVMKDDLALIVSDTRATAAAVFTQNRVVAGPVVIARKNVRAARGRMRGILGQRRQCQLRHQDRRKSRDRNASRAAAKAIGAKAEEGSARIDRVIGVELDPSLIIDAMPTLVAGLSAERFEDAARAAIMTTSLVMKTAYAQVKGARIAGMTKGSGMIHPRMATTLAFVTTDAVIAPGCSARHAEARRAGGPLVAFPSTATLPDQRHSRRARQWSQRRAPTSIDGVSRRADLEVLESLARQIVRDGEGAKKLITIDIEGATSERAAERIARCIANSPLVKRRRSRDPIPTGAESRFRPREMPATRSIPGSVDIDFQRRPCLSQRARGGFSEDELKAKLDEPGAR